MSQSLFHYYKFSKKCLSLKDMLGPSGFFQNIGDVDLMTFSENLEIIHDSEEGFNILYRVIKNGRFFVYKALKPEYRGDSVYEELLKKDFNIGFSLTHNGICQYYGMINLPQAGNCIVMEWIDGCSLEKLISEGGVSRSLAKKIICELCDAIEYMHHKQVIHKDLKPENILITYNLQNVKLIDFGLSDADSFTNFKIPAGTRIYASPEMVSGEAVDSRADIWSLGLIIQELSKSYHHVASRCLKRDRNKRYQSAADVKRAVLNQNRWRLFNVFACVLFVAVVVFSFIYLPRPKESSPAYTPIEPVTLQEDSMQIKLQMEPKPKDSSFDSPVVEEKKAEEYIDSSALEYLLNEAAEQL